MSDLVYVMQVFVTDGSLDRLLNERFSWLDDTRRWVIDPTVDEIFRQQWILGLDTVINIPQYLRNVYRGGGFSPESQHIVRIMEQQLLQMLSTDLAQATLPLTAYDNMALLLGYILDDARIFLFSLFEKLLPDAMEELWGIPSDEVEWVISGVRDGFAISDAAVRAMRHEDFLELMAAIETMENRIIVLDRLGAQPQGLGGNNFRVAHDRVLDSYEVAFQFALSGRSVFDYTEIFEIIHDRIAEKALDLLLETTANAFGGTWMAHPLSFILPTWQAPAYQTFLPEICAQGI